MKWIYLPVLLLLIYSNSTGQSIRFQLQRINPCNAKPVIDSFDYFLTDISSDSNYRAEYERETGIITLPKCGKYILNTYDLTPDTGTEIEIADTGLFIYQIIEPKIVFRTYRYLHAPSLYETCGYYAQGYQEDFFPNGNFRIRGTFSDGNPKDSLIIFFENGKPKIKQTVFPKDLFIEKYDSSGNITMISCNSTKKAWLTDYDKTEYYTNGKVKTHQTIFDKLETREDYYENGSLKLILREKYCIRYYPNGKVNVMFFWRSESDKIFENKLIIRKREFDKAGNMSEDSNYTDYNSINLQPQLDILDTDIQ